MLGYLRYICRFTIVGVCVALTALAIPWGVSRQPADTVDSYINNLVASGIPGVAVVISQSGQVTHKVSAGNIHISDRFSVASITKSFTAAVVMHLAENKHIDLDNPVKQYLPSFTLDDPRAGLITVRQILNQSSGITDLTLGINQYQISPTTPHQAVEMLSTSTLAYDPGSSWAYCNANYWIAHALVEKVTGISLSEYLDREFFRPLNMEATTLATYVASETAVVGNHSYVFGHGISIPTADWFSGGSGGISTTLDDLATWLEFHQKLHPHTNQVLSHDSLDELHRRQSPITHTTVGYALGWWNGEPADGGIPRISHSGSRPGSSTYVGMFPDKTAIAVHVNANAPDAYTIATDILAIQQGEARIPQQPPPAWHDSLACAFTILLLAGTIHGLRRRLEGRITRWSHVIAVLAAIGTALIAATPIIIEYLTQRQVSWELIYVQPVVIICAIFIAALFAILAATHLVVITRSAWQK